MAPPKALAKILKDSTSDESITDPASVAARELRAQVQMILILRACNFLDNIDNQPNPNPQQGEQERNDRLRFHQQTLNNPVAHLPAAFLLVLGHYENLSSPEILALTPEQIRDAVSIQRLTLLSRRL